MKNYIVSKALVILLISLFLTNCSKSYYYDDFDNDYGEQIISHGPDAIIDSEVIRVNNILYKLTSDDTCELISSYSTFEDHKCTYISNYIYPDFEIPSEVSLNGHKYSVTSVYFGSSSGYFELSNVQKIRYLNIPSSVLNVRNLYGLQLYTLIVGANVRSICEVRTIKAIWLPNTKPTGFDKVEANMAYSSTNYGSNVYVYSQLSSMFTEDGIVYVMDSPSNRTCDIIDSNSSLKNNLNINGSITHDDIEFKVQNINKYAFWDCSNIRSVNISNIEAIGSYAFGYCDNLSNVVLENINTIGNYTFLSTSIRNIKIPETITNIGYGAFKDCKRLEELNFSDGDKKLTLALYTGGSSSTKPYTLFENTNLKKLYIGRDLDYSTSYNSYSPFYRLDTLEEVEIKTGETEISNNMFYGCISLNSVIIGDDIIKIGNKAFSGCSAMVSFKFGKHLKTVGSDAFSDCTALKSFTSEAIEPPTCGNQALDDINKWECTLYVPNESIDLYKNAAQWKEFLKIE